MKRKTFLLQSSILSTAGILLYSTQSFSKEFLTPDNQGAGNLYEIFKEAPAIYRPFVRWWWNGDKIEKAELTRELQLLKDAGIGGVEINPIKFPQRTDDMSKPSLKWLSPEWIDMLDFTLNEAKKSGLTCDLIVGSGWPFGAEYLTGEEQAQVVVIGVKKLEGAIDYEAPLFDFLKEADPATTSPYAHRKLEILSLQLVPDPMTGLHEIKDLSDQIKSGFIKTFIPKGKYTLYALVKVSGFLEVINGAPGANGPVLNHYNKDAVKKYLHHMSDTIQQQIGPLKNRIRAFFADSLELEGANWTIDMADEFKRRRSYDIMPYLPYILFKTGGMGNVYDYNYGTLFSPEFKNIIERVRYDFDKTKTELLQERFIDSFREWCKENGIKSRAQAYGRGYHPLEGSFNMDIPECETWIKYGIGKEMPENDYPVGRAYTMVNKYVSSAAHLQGKRQISCEELTNTDMVFNETLQILKIGADQSTISGVTHPVFHGFNYSPKNSPFPGWIRYGNFMNERNTYWPYFKHFNDYKARLSALLQQADMFADIAILPPVYDMWAKYGAQNEPFPSLTYPVYLSLIWEAIHQNGNACDYISDSVIDNAEMKNGFLHYGPRKYHTLFLAEVESLDPITAKKLLEFLKAGGRIFCVESYPIKSTGLNNFQQRDTEAQSLVAEMKAFTDSFILLKKPEKDYLHWYKNIQLQYGITPYVHIDNADQFISQIRYQANNAEILLFTNSSSDKTFNITITPDEKIVSGKSAWLWDAVTGNRHKLTNSGQIALTLYAADLRIIVFDKNKKAKDYYKEYPLPCINSMVLSKSWTLEFRHIDGTIKNTSYNELKDLKDIPDFVNFSGTVIYRNGFDISGNSDLSFLDLGKVHGISEVKLNGSNCGVRWYGRHIYSIADLVKQGSNIVEISITTTMGNYMKTLKDNEVAQYWTNEKRKNQPIQSMGLVGPVTLI
jgi:alpha-L-rhamnosidase